MIIADFLHSVKQGSAFILFWFGSGGGNAEMLFIKTVKGGIVVKSTALASRLRVFALGYQLLRGNQSLGKNIAVDRRARGVAKNAVEVRLADVYACGN